MCRIVEVVMIRHGQNCRRIERLVVQHEVLLVGIEVVAEGRRRSGEVDVLTGTDLVHAAAVGRVVAVRGRLIVAARAADHWLVVTLAGHLTRIGRYAWVAELLQIDELERIANARMHRRENVGFVHGHHIRPVGAVVRLLLLLLEETWVEAERGGDEIHRVGRQASAEQLSEMGVVGDAIVLHHFAQRFDVVLGQTERFDLG